MVDRSTAANQTFALNQTLRIPVVRPPCSVLLRPPNSPVITTYWKCLPGLTVLLASRPHTAMSHDGGVGDPTLSSTV